LTNELKGIINLAISFEKESYVFYSGLKENIKNRALKDVLNDLAVSEIAHRTKLEGLLKKIVVEGENIFKEMEPKQVEDMKLSEYLVSMNLTEDSSFQDILIAAMHREARANKFYVNMQTLAKSEETMRLFEFLAHEELEHKNIIEKIYEDEVYKEF